MMAMKIPLTRYRQNGGSGKMPRLGDLGLSAV